MEKRLSSRDDALKSVAARLHTSALHLMRIMRRVDEAAGLSEARVSMLSIVVFHGPTPIGELARREQVSPPTMTKLVHALERAGLCRRVAAQDDGRSVVVTATAKGKKLLHAVRERRRGFLAERMRTLSDADLRTLIGSIALVEGIVSSAEEAQM